MSIKCVYDEIASFEGLGQAVHDVNLNHRYEYDSVKFWTNLEDNLHENSHRLYALDFPPDSYRSFFVFEPKLRKIICCDYTTKVIQRAAYNALVDKIVPMLIPDTTACITERGTLEAVNKVRMWMDYMNSSGVQWYYRRGDIHKYFFTIDHEILMHLWSRKVSDKRALRFLYHYTCETSRAFGLPDGVDNPMFVPDDEMDWTRGIPIGGGLSHLEANLYLDPLDQFVKHDLKIKYFLRHADDIIFFGTDKRVMNEQFAEIKDFIRDNLKLEFNNRTAMRPIQDGVEFVGYFISPHSTRLRKKTSLHMKRHLKQVQEQYREGVIDLQTANATVQSYIGLLKNCDSKALKKSMFENFVLTHDKGEKMQQSDTMVVMEPEPVPRRDQNLLELLDIYTDYIDKQNDIIKNLTEITRKQAREIEELRTINNCPEL